MKFYQPPDYQYPGMTRFVCHTTEEAFVPVLAWLNDVMPGQFVAHQTLVTPDVVLPKLYWEEVYIGQASNAALFKLTWDVVKT